ncbi:unnamed protein product [Caenorhabditis auriculariae]|uniref:SSD domain-containing protein n=1 Tax=Caenorhabditis auriculariae TaxID=2777116 RepID=A0A8S1HDT6_9PELO|nr:unnamed protein product [Caenorhabditis auriculariae]
MERVFYRLGLSIGHHPWRYILVLTLITFISLIGFLRFHQLNNARITYTASDSPSHIEGKMLEEFLRQNGTLHMMEVMVRSKDRGSLLRSEYLEQLTDLTGEIANIIQVQDEHGKNLTYRDLCEPYCQKNDALYALLSWYDEDEDDDDDEDGSSNDTSIELKYPVMKIYGKKVFIAGNIYDVSFKGNSSIIQGFSTVVLRYYMTHKTLQPMFDFEEKLVHLFYETDKYPLLEGGVASDNLIAKEVKAIGTKMVPLLGVALAVLTGFLIICSIRSKRRESKPLEAVLGAIIPVMSGLTTVGIVSATGLAFQSIVVGVLFLVLAIGIDDVFVILSAWHRTDKSLDTPRRLAETVQEAGCSMTVTSVTNFISFANGVFSTTSALQAFAVYGSVASIVCYVYQLVIFPAILAITAHKEYTEVDLHEKKCCVPPEIKVIKKAANFHDNAWKTLARIVEKPWMRILTIAVLVGYWYLTGVGITSMETDLAIQRIAPPHTRIVKFKIEYDRVIQEMQTVGVLVRHPGDLRNPKQLQKVQKMIHDFETAIYSYGNESTYAWIQPYLDHLAEEGKAKNVPFTYKKVPDFLKTDNVYSASMKVNESACAQNSPNCISAFLFTTGFTTVAKYSDMYPLLLEWRAISAKYPDLQVYAYSERSNFADQTHDMVGTVWQTVLSEVVCMALSFVLFIPDLVSILAAFFSLLSVNMGVFGFLSLWGVRIDPVSISTLLMAIGFSVDIGAHISYHIYQEKLPTMRQKIERSLLHIGWPTMQGGLSTMLAMMPITFHPSYLGMVFFKSVFLVSMFGLVHGLVVLPVFLSMFSQLFGYCKGRRDQVGKGSEGGSGYSSSSDSDKQDERFHSQRASINNPAFVKGY